MRLQDHPWLQIPKSGRDRLKVAVILSLVLVVSAFHFGTSTDYRYLHEIYQRVYYIPILLAAFWYGPLAGLLAALGVSTVYVFHIRWDWHHTPVYTFNQYAEICLYHTVALIIGFLSMKQRQQREQLEATSQELGSAYRKLQETFEHLRRADRLAALGELSAGIAHEIRNPLASVKGSVEILESEFPASHPKREFVEIIKEETERLNHIVGSFLNFARPPDPSIRQVAVEDLINSTVNLLRKEAESTGVEVRTTFSEDLPDLNLDPDQVRQVLLNILLNGIQAMPSGGLLQIHTYRGNDGSTAVIEISDSGPGVADDKLETIFDPFYTTKSTGTGLGLSISHQLVERHGGHIEALRRPQGGMSFRVVFPL